VTRRNCSAVATFHADSREPPGTGVGAIELSLLRLSPGGRVLQDLSIWDLVNAKAPMALTSTGAAFGAQWLAAPQTWQP